MAAWGKRVTVNQTHEVVEERKKEKELLANLQLQVQEQKMALAKLLQNKRERKQDSPHALVTVNVAATPTIKTEVSYVLI